MTLNCADVARAALGPPRRRQGAELFWACPNHADEHPSLQVNQRKNCWMCGPCGKSGSAWDLAACFAGHDHSAKHEITGWLRARHLLDSGGRAGGADCQAPALTVEELARHKRLPLQFLVESSVHDSPEGVLITYRLTDGSLAPRQRIRTAVVAKEGSRWSKGDGPIVPYGLWRLAEAREKRFIVLVEGESDTWTLWHHGFPCLGIPGSSMTQTIQPEHLTQIERVYIVQEPDSAGDNFVSAVARRLREIAWKGDSCCVKFSNVGVKDPNELHLLAPQRFPEAFQAALVKATPIEPTDTQSDAKGQTPGLKLTKLGDLLSEPEEQVNWLVDSMLPSGGLSLLVAKPKVGKSTLARDLALRVARGEPFLGRDVAKGGVIYLALEEKRSEVRNHFRAMGANGSEEIYVHAAHAPEGALQAVIEEVRARKPVLLVVDPLLKFTRVRDANDYAQVTSALEPLLILAREYNVHVLVVHHLGKGERAEATDQILGSTAFYAAVDTALALKKRDQCRTLQTSQRYGEDMQETILTFDSEARTVSLGLPRSEAEAERIGVEILAYFESQDESKDEPEVMDAVEGKTQVKKSTLRRLLQMGKLARTGNGRKGDPYVYTLPHSAPPPPEDSGFSGSRYMSGTREPGTENVAGDRINTGPILVPEFSQSPPQDLESREPEESAPKMVQACPTEVVEL